MSSIGEREGETRLLVGKSTLFFGSDERRSTCTYLQVQNPSPLIGTEEEHLHHPSRSTLI
ncbi:hypothetical protein A2U01_0061394, partial [Trifolium medium]|nr:hypothetical protein [Trifolium medium]